MPYGLMVDLINCYQIDLGRMLPVNKKKMSFDEAISLR